MEDYDLEPELDKIDVKAYQKEFLIGAKHYTLNEFNSLIKILQKLNISNENAIMLFDVWFEFIENYPIECIDSVCSTQNKRLINLMLNRFLCKYKTPSFTNNETKEETQLKNIKFTAACYTNNLNQVKMYLENDNSIDLNYNQFNNLLPPLHIACDACNLELIKLLLSDLKRINVNLLARQKPNSSALHKLCEASIASINDKCDAQSKQQEEILKLLIKCNINLNLCNQYNETALHVAVYYENYVLIKLLLQQSDINVNIRTVSSLNSRTCLHYCCNSSSDNLNIFKQLVKHKQINARLLDSKNENILQIASKNDNINICKFIIEELNFFELNTNLTLLADLLYKTIETYSIEMFKYYIKYITIKQIYLKLNIENLLESLKKSNNFYKLLDFILNNAPNLIKTDYKCKTSYRVENKLLKHISNEHVDNLTEYLNNYDDYLNKKKLFTINNFYLNNLINLFKHVSKFDIKIFEKILINHLHIYNILNNNKDLCMRLNLVANKNNDKNGKQLKFLYNDEELLIKLFGLIMLNGTFNSYFEMKRFIQNFIKTCINQLDNNFVNLFDYLNYQSNEILTLKQLCRIKIRMNLINLNENTIYSKLINYPIYLKKYLNFSDIF